MKWPWSSSTAAAAPPPPPTPPPLPPREKTAYDIYGPGSWSILFHQVNLEAYPWLENTPFMNEYPGMALIELGMLRGIRYGTFAGFLLSPLAFFVMRKRLPFADRPLLKFHHVFFPSAGYGVYFGAPAGIVETCYRAHCQLGPSWPNAEQEKALVKASIIQRMNKDNERWCRTAGRLGFCGLTSTVFFWKDGSVWLRACMGLGIGVATAAVISSIRIDHQLELVS